ncbi:hypothetical protein C8R45DRAFT_1130749 [Mycena sanguinolenta]|nr:hypothetical protein C8R45DRAFT_1130749 [Mycena sanguinolenta]
MSRKQGEVGSEMELALRRSRRLARMRLWRRLEERRLQPVLGLVLPQIEVKRGEAIHDFDPVCRTTPHPHEQLGIRRASSARATTNYFFPTYGSVDAVQLPQPLIRHYLASCTPQRSTVRDARAKGEGRVFVICLLGYTPTSCASSTTAPSARLSMAICEIMRDASRAVLVLLMKNEEGGWASFSRRARLMLALRCSPSSLTMSGWGVCPRCIGLALCAAREGGGESDVALSRLRRGDPRYSYVGE